MKKLLGILAVAALTTSVFAQGTVTFQNATGKVTKWTSSSDPTPVNVAVGGGFVELFAAPVGTALTPLGELTAGGFSLTYNTLAAFLAANPGWAAPTFASGTPITAIAGLTGNFSGGNATVNSVAGGVNINYFVIGWTGSATTLDAAIASGTAFIGESAIFTTATGNPNGTPVAAPVNLKTTFSGMILAPVPEPTSFALAGLGLAALLVFRRRN